MLCLCPYWFKYDGSWMNGRLSGPVNMILPNHVYLGTFYDSLVSINSYEICVDRDPLVWVEMTGIKQVTCNITRGGGEESGKGTFPYKVPLNFFKQNAVFSPILMSCATLRTWSSSQQ